jgi:ABC-2 type transport system permease protein
VNVLGNPDNGIIFTGYLGSFLMASAFLALGAFVSALTKNQVIAFILAATLCFLFVMSGVGLVQNVLLDWAPGIVASAVSSMSFLSHFEQIARGVVTAPTVMLFLSIIVFALFANVVAIDQKKAA